MQIAGLLAETLVQTLLDIAPIAIVIGVFQALVFRQVPRRLARLLAGTAAIVVGIALFRAGLDLSLVPMGEDLAARLAGRVAAPEHSTVLNAVLLVVFAGALGFAATMVEPTLTTIAQRVRELTGGGLTPLTFRLVVSTGVALGLSLGTTRILAGIPYLYVAGPLVLLIGTLALLSPKAMVPLALDSGPMATSVVTVPIVAAFGASLARHLPERDPLADGFGLVMLALLTPVASLLLMAKLRLSLGRAT